MLYNENEFKRMLMHFYHPTPSQLYNLIRRIDSKEANTEAKRILEVMSNKSEKWQEIHSGLLRVRVAIPNTDMYSSLT